MVYCDYVNIVLIIFCSFFLYKLEQKIGIIYTNYNIHRFMLAAIMLSIKMIMDTPLLLKYLAIMGGITPENLIQCEQNIIKLLDWELNVEKEIIDKLILMGNS